jgi:hypothetical protein
MKQDQFKQLFATLAAAVLILFAPGCATQGNDVADTEVERALLNSGFKVRDARTAEQREHFRRMPDNQFTMVKQPENTYYLYPDKRDNRLYVGDQWAYRAYQGYVKNKHLRAQGVFVWEVNPSDRANNRTVEVWNGWAPFGEW